MAIVQAPPIVSIAPTRSAARDTGIDLVRALCVTGVVLLHAIMVGVTVVDGAPVFENAGDGSGWMAPVSWLLQVMPLFFIIGGFAGAMAYRRQRARGGTATAFIASRIHRLLRPAVITIAFAGAALAALAATGVPADLIVIAGFRYGQPLWFLGVFLLCQALLPVLLWTHERAPLRALAALVAGALLVDALRAASGIDGIGFLNLALVWPALQQLGFFFADGTIDSWSRRTRIAGATASLAALVATFTTGMYSPDLIANINPPTGALLLVGVIHLLLVSLLRDRIRAVSLRPRIAALSTFVNSRTMTIYLWHMPVLLAMAGLSAVAAIWWGAVLPAPSSALWWLGRPLWLAAALALTAVVATMLAGLENGPARGPIAAGRRIAVATGVALAGIVLLLVVGTTVLTAAVAVGALLLALRLARASTSAQSAGDQGVADVVRMA